MHVCCVYVRQFVNKYFSNKIFNMILPLGISYISSSLKKEGYTTEIFYCNPFTLQDYKEGISNYIEKEPQIIAISLMSSFDLNLTINLVSVLKKKFCNAKIIIGGVYVTLEPNLILNAIKEIDALCIGAGEKAVVEYVKQVKENRYYQTNNLWIKNGQEVIKCDKVLSIENLDELPFPDRKGWEKWLNSSDPTQIVSLSRGCTYNCIFCANKELRKKIDNFYFNERSVKNIMEEIDYLVKNYRNIKYIYFVCENATANIEKFKNLCIALKKYNDKLKNKISFYTNINFTQDLLEHDDFIKLVKEANFKVLEFSLESGSYDIRKKLGKPLYNNDQFIYFCELLHKQKIGVMIYTMYCFPYETQKTYMETVRCLSKCKPESYTNSWLTVPGYKVQNITLIDVLRYIFFRLLVYIRYKNVIEAIRLSYAQLFFPILELKRCFDNIGIIKLLYRSTLNLLNKKVS